MSDPGLRLVSVLGFGAMITIAWGFSSDRKRFPWRTVLTGSAIQLTLGVLLLKTAVGRLFFDAMSAVVGAFIRYTEAGTNFVFESREPSDWPNSREPVDLCSLYHR